jgi:hypothetical protein
MDEKEKIKRIKSLDIFEVRTIYYRKKEYNEDQIQQAIGYAKSKQSDFIRDGLTKLGIPLVKGEEKQRWPLFITEYDKVFSQQVPNEDTLKDWKMEEYKPEPVTPPEPPETPEPAPVPSSKSPDSPLWRKYLIPFMACSVLGVIAIVILILSLVVIQCLRGSCPAILQPATSTPNVVGTLVETMLASVTPPTPKDTLVPLISPTDTLHPTDTPIPPTPTDAFVPPSDGILFQDNFDNGFSPEWEVVEGRAIITNGKLYAEDPSTFLVGESWWENYIIEFDVGKLYPSQNIGIGVHVQDLNNMYWYHLTEDSCFWNIVTNGDYLKSYERNECHMWEGHVKLTVEDGNYSMTMAGRNIGTLWDNAYPKGKVSLYQRHSIWIDNFVITYLP